MPDKWFTREQRTAFGKEIEQLLHSTKASRNSTHRKMFAVLVATQLLHKGELAMNAFYA